MPVGRAAEYHAIIYGLWNLDRILLQVELIFQSREHTDEFDVIRATVCQRSKPCRQCITDYRQKMKRFRKSLGVRGSGTLAGVTSNIRR